MSAVSCSTNAKKEYSPNDLNIPEGVPQPHTESDAELANCPGTSISSEEYKKYSSDSYNLDRETTEILKSNSILTTFESSLDIQEQSWMFDVYQLFERQKDTVKVLVRKNEAKLIKELSPLDLDRYIYNSDSLLADGASPTYYYFERDTLKMIEHHHFDNVEGCSFSKESRFFRNNQLTLIRKYNFELNCWSETEQDSLESYFQETLCFINDGMRETFSRRLDFYPCSRSNQTKFIVVKRDGEHLPVDIEEEERSVLKY